MKAWLTKQKRYTSIPVEEGDARENVAGPLLGHVFKKAQVEAGEGGSRVAAAIQRDEHEKAMTEDRAKFERNDPVDVNETNQSSCSGAEISGAADIMHKRLLEEMQWLCRTAQDKGTEWKVKSNMKALRDIRKTRKSKKECV